MSLLIDTDDIATFGGKQVDVEILPKLNQIDKARTLLIKIDFQLDVDNDDQQRFGFDLTKLVVPAITCTKADSVWLIKLPEIVSDELGSVTL